MNGEITFGELTSLEDGLLLPWLDLYETAFPPYEKVLVSHFLSLLKSKNSGQGKDEFMLAALDSTGGLLGLACYQRMPEVGLAVLWYLAVHPEARNRGVGGKFYDHIAGLAKEAGCRALLLEVEIPERGETAGLRDLAARRINFYRRRGALVLQGVDYLQFIGPHQPATPMYIMVHPLETLPVQEYFDLAKFFAGRWLTRVGPLGLA